MKSLFSRLRNNRESQPRSSSRSSLVDTSASGPSSPMVSTPTSDHVELPADHPEPSDERNDHGHNNDHARKVTFRSPAPSTALALDDLPSKHEAAPTQSRSASRQSRSTSRQSLSNVSRTATPLSPTNSEQSLDTTRSYLPQPNSWSEMAEEDLIANLGPRERTRQEVLWEIVSSEERYVQELIKLNETFCTALLPLASPSLDFSPLTVPELPIASQYTNPRTAAYNALTNGRPTGHPSSGRNGIRTHSLPPRPLRSSLGQPLPDSLEKVLTVLSKGILEGHIKLASALRRRYDNQYPLVRSLADVFTAHSYILREYATYVLHLEKALEQVDHALSLYTSKRTSRRFDETEIGRLGKTLLSLEEAAATKGESGLAISLSKPFQRLLKYPLLFQNLLFNTDPSLKEYEATLAMVDEVEDIVRTIEDEKASSEEREKTRDAWARIDGLRDKTLMVPKANRLLVSECEIVLSETEVKTLRETSKQRKSLRRLSDILKGQNDLWVVRFTDVSLLCERTGMTTLPFAVKTDSAAERRARSSRRHGSIRARNLYRFVKVHEWHLKEKQGSPLLDMDVISRNREKPLPETKPLAPPTKAPIKDTPTMTSDRLSVMSFAFKGSDQLKPARPSASASPSKPPATRRISGGHITGNAANAKFAHRLRNDPDETIRPISRSRNSLPPAMKGRSSPALSQTDKNTASPKTQTSSPSVRGIKGARMDVSVTGSGQRYIPKSRSEIKPTPSTDSAVAGMWNAYREGGAVGTPKRALPQQQGGRI